jgi:hypothetical protein
MALHGVRLGLIWGQAFFIALFYLSGHEIMIKSMEPDKRFSLQ